jgi:hypothetical protein
VVFFVFSYLKVAFFACNFLDNVIFSAKAVNNNPLIDCRYPVYLQLSLYLYNRLSRLLLFISSLLIVFFLVIIVLLVGLF